MWNIIIKCILRNMETCWYPVKAIGTYNKSENLGDICDEIR
ncbi:hypothetical protein PAECIP111802_05334 [Paenibacillus allorhizosphaerae]|uniref:Uncharacterized protein n=1 Tax=Paenibacillus allorhizosphaerae TaxID=2849866 RepID=A0ABN7TRJ0_9BACL|nr:hypothetical protein PAECIP111802_05334 [Paenibacillus allorhizosphaerae]